MADASLNQFFSQQQTLAPQMRKSLEILQASSLELGQLVQQALAINPVLEDVTETQSLDETSADPEEADSLEYLNQTDDDWRDRSILERKSSPSSQEDEERRQRVYDSIVAPETLQQHLQKQLDLSSAEPPIRKAAQAILGNLNNRGFLDLPLEMLAARLGLKLRHLEAALKLVQSFDPVGIGACGIAESLLLQLEFTTGKETLDYKIVLHHLEDLARKRHPQIARELFITVEQVAEAAIRISRLSPNPGGEYDPTGNPYILPDVIIERDDDRNWYARLTGEYLPNLRINDFYKDLIGKSTTDGKARQFLRDQIRDGRSLIQAISLRQETVLAIAHKLIEHQPGFLEKGHRHLRPLTMHDLAGELNLHPTTISRAVAGKYLSTPHGLMEMRAFFAVGYVMDDGNEVSNAGVREALQRLISAEDRSNPLSDTQLTHGLGQQGITLARRTVAKYREQLDILPSYLRKTH